MGHILNCHIRFVNVRKKTEYTYTIKGTVAFRGSDREFAIEYSGTDLNVVSGYINSDIVTALKNFLNENVKHGPFKKWQVDKLKSITSIVFLVHGQEVIGEEVIYKD
ncbi:hypothetical protein [Lysinibacillus fusiformis]|uniref:hypothetical protein n=1 Tax=Lysinibacillus fusiformis TaxID=28031 RepID=UPI003CFD7897